MQTVIPKIISDLLSNPGIGFIAAPHLMGDPAELRDNRGTPVEKYRFPQSTKTWNHPDSGLYYCGGRWKELEPEPGEYRWDILDNGLEKARQMGCTSIVRIAPYALRPEEDVPLWMRERWPEEPDYPFWRVDPNTTDYAERWSEFIRAFAARFDGDERISSVYLAITGAWGEGGGSEFVVPEKLEQVVSAYLDGFTKTPIQALLHDPVSVACIRRHRAKVGFRVDCLGDMGGFHPGQWSHMEDYYPQNVVNFHMQDAWKEAPVVFEACWHTNDWYLQGWDIDYIIDESLKWHISSYNAKGTTIPQAWEKSIERWVRKMGYRYEIHSCTLPEQTQAGGTIDFEMLVSNTGVAPCYHNYSPMLRFAGENASFDLPIQADIRQWMPDADVRVAQRMAVPENAPKGTYQVKLGFPVPGYLDKTLRLAIGGRDADGFYPLCAVRVV